MLLGGAGGSFGTAANFAAGAQPYSVAVGDFNGDADPDLAVANANSQQRVGAAQHHRPSPERDGGRVRDGRGHGADGRSARACSATTPTPTATRLTAALVSGPRHGSLTLNADGSFTYTPDPGLQRHRLLQLPGNDGSRGSDPATVTLDVRPVDDLAPPAGPAPGPSAPVGPLSGACANAKSGSAGANRLAGGAFGDRLLGLAGDDVLMGRAGDDCLSGGPGNDRLGGGPGNDRLGGGPGNDRLGGGPGNDRLGGGPGNDQLRGGSGNDTINSRDRRRETVRCGKGTNDRVRADRSDRLIGCERVTLAR